MAGNQPLNAPIADTEPLTRFVTDSDNLKSTGRVHWRAFRLRHEDQDLSIARIESLAPEDVWTLGDELAGRPSGRTVFGRADFTAVDVRAARVNERSLEARPDEPPRRHATIVGWPEDPNGRKVIAIMLAAATTQAVRPTTPPAAPE